MCLDIEILPFRINEISVCIVNIYILFYECLKFYLYALFYHMVLRFGLTKDHELEPPIYNLNICLSFMYLKVYNNKLCLICLTFHM